MWQDKLKTRYLGEDVEVVRGCVFAFSPVRNCLACCPEGCYLERSNTSRGVAPESTFGAGDLPLPWA